jgi:FMN-dependent NADH-azoreductase
VDNLHYLCLFIEGHAAMPDNAEGIKQNAIQRAKDLAHIF